MIQLAEGKRADLQEDSEVANLWAEIEATVGRIEVACDGDPRSRYRLGALRFYIDAHPERTVDGLKAVLTLAREAEHCTTWNRREEALERLMDAVSPGPEAH
ncbi:MAG: hypothetical protein AAFU73_05220 [Planctomycetota bacterium]